MKFLPIILLAFLVSCKSAQKLHSTTEYQTHTQVVEQVKSDSSATNYTGYTTAVTIVDTTVIVTTTIEYETIQYKDTLITVPKTQTVTEVKKGIQTAKKEDTATYSSSQVSGTDSIILDYTANSQEEFKLSEKKNNTAIVKGFYLLIVLIIGGYIVIKKYFPSIFVLIKNIL